MSTSKLSPTGNSDSGSKEGLRPPAAGSLCGVCGRPNVQAGDDGCARLLTGDDEDFAADYTAECYAKGYERAKARADRLEAWKSLVEQGDWPGRLAASESALAQGQGATKELPRAAAQAERPTGDTFWRDRYDAAMRLAREYEDLMRAVQYAFPATAHMISGAIREFPGQPCAAAPDSPSDSAPLEGPKDLERAAAPLRLVWYSRNVARASYGMEDDGLFNADCACGATIVGTDLPGMAEAERWHFQQTEQDRAHGHKRYGCGPTAPRCPLGSGTKGTGPQAPTDSLSGSVPAKV